MKSSLCLLSFIERSFLIIVILTLHLSLGVPKTNPSIDVYIRYVLYGIIYL